MWIKLNAIYQIHHTTSHIHTHALHILTRQRNYRTRNTRDRIHLARWSCWSSCVIYAARLPSCRCVSNAQHTLVALYWDFGRTESSYRVSTWWHDMFLWYSRICIIPPTIESSGNATTLLNGVLCGSGNLQQKQTHWMENLNWQVHQ